KFVDVHDSYLDAWGEAMRTGVSSPVETFLAPDYHGWFAPDAGRQEPYDRADGIAGMRQSVADLQGAAMIVGTRRFNARGPADVVVTYDKEITSRGEPVARSLIVEAWSRDTDGWRLHRELTEHGVGPAEQAGQAVPD